MTSVSEYRKVIAVCPCVGAGEAIYCDDGAVFYSLPNGADPRVHIEGTAVPGTERSGVQKREQEWESVARNLAQILLNTADWLHEAAANGPTIDEDMLRAAFKNQCEVHGVTP